MHAKVREFSVFNRLFILYSLMLVVIYIVLIVVFLSNINRSSLELINSKHIQAENYEEYIVRQLDSIYTQQVNLINNSDVSRLAYAVYSNKYEKNQLVLDLLRTIEGIQSMNPLIEDIIVTFPDQDITLSTEEGYKKESAYDWEKIASGSEYNYLVTYDQKLILNFTYPLMFSVSENYVPDCNIQVVISREILEQGLGIFADDRGSGAAIWFDLENNFVIDPLSRTVISEFVKDSNIAGFSTKEEQFQVFDQYQLVISSSSKYPVYLIAYIDRSVLNQIKIKYILILTLVMLLISGMFAFSLIYSKRIVVKPVQELMQAFSRLQEGDFDVRIYHEPHDEFNYLYLGFNKAVEYIQELILNIYEQENLLQNAELAQLQSQINPHFLYNSFFIINRMAKNESYELITKFVTSLAKYYRFINKESKHFIPLNEEVEHMMNYIDIQQMRFGEKIDVDIEPLPSVIAQHSVPKLILQPIVENAYNYGLSNKLDHGLIRIRYLVEERYIKIVVEDNGEDATDELVVRIRAQIQEKQKMNENHALTNINRRLSIAYGTTCGIDVSLSELGGIAITLVMDASIQL